MPWWKKDRIESGEEIPTDPVPQTISYGDESGNEYSTTIHALDHQILSPFDCPKCGKVDAMYNGVEVRCTRCDRVLRCERCVGDNSRTCKKCIKITRPVLIAFKEDE